MLASEHAPNRHQCRLQWTLDRGVHGFGVGSVGSGVPKHIPNPKSDCHLIKLPEERRRGGERRCGRVEEWRSGGVEEDDDEDQLPHERAQLASWDLLSVGSSLLAVRDARGATGGAMSSGWVWHPRRGGGPGKQHLLLARRLRRLAAGTSASATALNFSL